MVMRRVGFESNYSLWSFMRVLFLPVLKVPISFKSVLKEISIAINTPFPSAQSGSRSFNLFPVVRGRDIAETDIILNMDAASGGNPEVFLVDDIIRYENDDFIATFASIL